MQLCIFSVYNKNIHSRYNNSNLFGLPEKKLPDEYTIYKIY